MLADLCFRHVPSDVRERAQSVVLAGLWHLHRRAVLVGLPAGMPHRWGAVGAVCGLDRTTYREAVAQLLKQRLVQQSPPARLGLTPAGYARCRELFDVDAILTNDRGRLAGAVSEA